MNIICTQENLKFALSQVSRIVPTSGTLPILSNVLLKTENGLLKVFATNLEIAIITETRCKVEEEGEITVVCKNLVDLINNLPNTNITLQKTEGGLKIETENYHTMLKTLPAEDFPIIPQIEGSHSISVPAQELKKALEWVFFSASNNQTQPEISGVSFKKNNQELKIAATDRYRLAEKKLLLKQNNQFSLEAILPQKTVVEIVRLTTNETSDVAVVFGQTQCEVSFDHTKIISRLVGGQYPPYEQIFPSDSKTKASVKVGDIRSALKTTMLFSQSTQSVKIAFLPEKGKINIFSETGDLGKSEVEITCLVTGETQNILINPKYILDCLSVLESETVKIDLIDESAPVVFKPENDTNYLYLVMPIKN